MKRLATFTLVLLASCAYSQDPRYPHPSRSAPEPHEQVIRHGARATMSSTQAPWHAANCYAQAYVNRSGGRLAANVVRDGPDERWRVNVTDAVPGGAYVAVIRVVPAASGSTAEMFMTPMSHLGGGEGFRRSLAERCH